MKHIILILLLQVSLLPAAEDGGLTGETDPTITKPQSAALAIRDMRREAGKQSAATLDQAVVLIGADAPAFWARVGTKGKRTLKWLTDLLADADAAAPTGEDYVTPRSRAMLAKWTANPDNTVTVSP